MSSRFVMLQEIILILIDCSNAYFFLTKNRIERHIEASCHIWK